MDYLLPKWQAPSTIKALTTLRCAGVSQGCFRSFNLALHVNDVTENVIENRKILECELLPNPAVWLEQVHSNKVVTITDNCDVHALIAADGLYTQCVNQPLAIMTADCLPIFFADLDGNEVAIIHAGWRGLSSGIIENTLALFCAKPASIIAHLGPAISQAHFEVGRDVYDTFYAWHKKSIQFFQSVSDSNKYYADLYGIARSFLIAQGVKAVTGGEHCTYRENDNFFSYRRDGQCGRNAHLIWLE